MQQSFPVEQPQPNQEFYGLDVLPLLQTYTRDSYRAAGNGDPAWDPSRPEQDWWDDGYANHPPDEQVTFSAIVSAGDGTATIGSYTQKAAWMAKPNFKGLPAYPKWNPAPTTAHTPPDAVNPSGTSRDVFDMSTLDQAHALMAEIGGTGVVELGLSISFPGFTIPGLVYDPADPRRPYVVTLANGSQINVGQALRLKYVDGIGHPGHWMPSPEGGIMWQSDPVPDGSTATGEPLPPPCRPLKANEQLETFMAATWFKGTRIHRKDLAVPPPTPSGGTSTDAGDLADIKTKVTALYNLLVPHN
jgi:hypothetical protein